MLEVERAIQRKDHSDLRKAVGLVAAELKMLLPVVKALRLGVARRNHSIERRRSAALLNSSRATQGL